MGSQNQQEAAEKVGISKSNFTRWKAGARADPDFVVKIARAYNANVLDALVESGFITDDEAELVDVYPTRTSVLESLTDLELADEQRRRAQRVVVVDSKVTALIRKAVDDFIKEHDLDDDAGEYGLLRDALAEARTVSAEGNVLSFPKPTIYESNMSDVPDRVAASDRASDSKHQPDDGRGEESQDPGSDDPA